MDENGVAREVVDAAYRIHSALGPGLLESVYEAALGYEPEKRALKVLRQVGVPVLYEEVRIHAGFFADLIIDLRLADKRLGVLVNFNVPLIKDGIVRIANDVKD